MGTYDLLRITAKNIGLGIADTFSAGMGSAAKHSITEIQEYTQKTNEALYYLQVKTFLETADLNQEEVNQFFEKNPDNLRLGVEIFKILEQTYIEKQSQMIARAFTLYVLGKINRKRLDHLVHIITSLNQHLINTLEDYLPEEEITTKEFDLDYESIGLATIFGESTDYSKEEISYDRKVWNFFGNKKKNVPQEFINWGFYQATDVPLTVDLEKLPAQEHEPTRFFLWFVTLIMKENYKEEECTE